MFGYIRPDLPNLYIKDSVLYRSFYCGLCKSIGKGCGTTARFSLSYDLAFLSALIHNMAGQDVEITDQRCILHPIIKRPIAKPTEISKAVAYLNVFMAYYKLTDDIADQNKGRVRRLFFKKGYKRAALAMPKVETVIKREFERLISLEKQNCDSVDIAADPFGSMVADLSQILLGDKSTENSYNLFYNIGKFIYLIDALDDYDKDIAKKNYNVFYNAFGANSKQFFIDGNKRALEFIFGSVFASIKQSLSGVKFYFNSDLTDNILLKGMPSTFNKILNKDKKKCKIRTKF